MPARLTDLDELVLSVRNKTSREYILEAIDAYRGGAYRSAIVATWIAVFYDILDKIKSIANTKDKDAGPFIGKFYHVLNKEEDPNVKKIYFGDLESSILDTARGFGLISDHEANDLERLRKDRHVCAHPAFVKPEELFQPTPELVRTHIAHAILHLLRHPPLKGKRAIESILHEIKEERVFYDRQGANQHLREKYFIATPDRSIVSSLIARLLEELFQAPETEIKTMRQGIHYTLLAIEQLNADLYKQTFREQLREKLDKLSGDPLLRVFWLRRKNEQCWEVLSQEHWQKVMDALTAHFEHPDVADTLRKYNIFDSLDLMNEEEQKKCLQHFSDLEPRDRREIIQRTRYSEFAEAAIELLAIESDPEGADELGKEILIPLAEYFTREQVMEVLEIFHPLQGNRNVWQAEDAPEILLQFWHKIKEYFPATKDSWKWLLQALLEKDENYGGVFFVELREEIAQSDVELEKTQQEEHV